MFELVKSYCFELQQEMIAQSFKKCCINMATDITEDDAIFWAVSENDELDTDDIYPNIAMREINFKVLLEISVDDFYCKSWQMTCFILK